MYLQAHNYDPFFYIKQAYTWPQSLPLNQRCDRPMISIVLSNPRLYFFLRIAEAI